MMVEKTLGRLPEDEATTKIAKLTEGSFKRHKEDITTGDGTRIALNAAPANNMSPPLVTPPISGTPFRAKEPAVKLEGIELCGDEAWFADPGVRRILQESVIAVHAEQKILVGTPADEIKRICPSEGPLPSAGAVLRLGSTHLGGYGEADIAYAYRQLSRLVHPEKNSDIVEAPIAFKRLTEAVDELQQGLMNTRAMLQSLCMAMGSAPAPEMLERPQGLFFAEATRLLYAVLGLSGEGKVVGPALDRALPAFASSPVYSNCQAQRLLSDWYDQPHLLDVFANPPLRMAYDCSPKRLRAQFLCALNRTMLSEAKRHRDCVRGTWQAIMMQFPEMGLWRDFLDKLKSRVWTLGDNDRCDGSNSQLDDDSGSQTSDWARRWRDIMCAVLPSNVDGAASADHCEVRKMAAACWRDVVEWARQTDAERHLSLFTAELSNHAGKGQQDVDPNSCRADWAFVPAMDLFLVIGEGIVGVTAEGLFVNTLGHETQTFANAFQQFGKKKHKKERKYNSKDERKDAQDSRIEKVIEEDCPSNDIELVSIRKEGGRQHRRLQIPPPSMPTPWERCRSRSNERRCWRSWEDPERLHTRPQSKMYGNARQRNGDSGHQATGRVFVTNLPSNINEGVLERLFQRYGKVLGLKVIIPRYRKDNATAIIRYDRPAAAEAAIAALNEKYELRPREGMIKVKHAKPNPQWD